MNDVTGRDIHMDLVCMRYPGAHRDAVKDIDVHIKAGEFFSFLGPSGCGKTTLLRLISGFIDPTGGDVRIGGQNMRGIGPNKRPTAMIFQNLALFPLMTVAENIGFGLEVRGAGKSERRRRASELLELVDLPGAEDKRVSDLSGGQRQRVAIARGLAVQPSVLLLDEPLSALDLKLRQHMRAELRKIQKRTGVTFIYITHDQGEALTMSDRIGVLSDQGRLLQVDQAVQLYNEPDTPFVANFVGENNAFRARLENVRNGCAVARAGVGTIKGLNPKAMGAGDEAVAFVRPEAISILADPAGADNSIRCRVVNLSFEGAFVTIFLQSGDHKFVMRQSSSNVHELPDVDSIIEVGFSAESTRFLPFVKTSDD